MIVYESLNNFATIWNCLQNVLFTQSNFTTLPKYSARDELVSSLPSGAPTAMVAF
jgi:hypothetical protein